MASSVLPLVTTAVSKARNAVLGLVGLLVAWTTLSPNVRQFTVNQHKNVATGVSTIKYIQSYRKPFLDRFFTAMTFFGEEEFYLIVLPWLFWNIEHKLGTQATAVVCTGIFSGNFLKDMFLIPRPPRDKVWVSTHLVNADSTGLRDFGFPSTHSLNAFSNPAFFIAYYLGTNTLSTDSPGPLTAAAAVATLYCAALAVSRLYLGVHSPSDVRAGLFMGVMLVAAYGSVGEWVYAWVTTSEGVVTSLVLGTVLLLVLSPQPRVRTPTFLQNCVLVGLLLGNLLGSRLWFHKNLFDEVGAAGDALALSPNAAASVCGVAGGLGGALAFSLLRYVVGLVIVVLMRLLGKLVINNALNLTFGIKLFVHGDEHSDDSLTTILEAVSKTSVYTFLALGVTFGAPLAHHALGLTELTCA